MYYRHVGPPLLNGKCHAAFQVFLLVLTCLYWRFVAIPELAPLAAPWPWLNGHGLPLWAHASLLPVIESEHQSRLIQKQFGFRGTSSRFRRVGGQEAFNCNMCRPQGGSIHDLKAVD